MGISENKVINDKIEQIIEYYLLQKKIEYIVSSDNNPLVSKSKNFFDSFINPYDKQMEESYYIIDETWINTWKIYSKYDLAKSYFDKIKVENKSQFKKEIIDACKNMILTGEITDSNDGNPGPMYNKITGENFCLKLYIGPNKLDCLVNNKIFLLFSKLSNQFWFNITSTNTVEIKAIIGERMIILILKKQLKVKFIFFYNNEFTELTADFCVGDNYTENEHNNMKKNLKNFVYKELRELKFNDWMNIFNNNNIYAVDEVPVIDDNAQVLYNLRNDKLYLMTLSGENRYVSSETFLNVTQIRLIGLANIGATCYMNATLQCFINNDMLTSYLLTESNYKKIIKNGSNLCELTSKYCELLMNVCCNADVKNYFIPRKFKEVISRKNILFKGIKANDSKDLINFMLEEMNNELNSVENENNSTTYIHNSIQIDQTDKEFMYNFFKTQYTRNNTSIIPKIFFFTIENQTKCLKCNLIKYNYQVVYMFDFALSATYDFCLQNNIYLTNSNYGQNKLSLFNCFEFYIRPSFFTGDNQIYCSRCQMKVNALYGNHIYSLSPTIIISLNRGKDNEFNCSVDFPEVLDLKPFVLCQKSMTKYRLKAVISHLGESGLGGHFIAYCRHRIIDKWYCYNDSVVTECRDQLNDFRKGTPYILFYESMEGNNNILYDESQNNINNNINLNENPYS